MRIVTGRPCARWTIPPVGCDVCPLNRLINGRRDRARRAEILATVERVPDADLTADLLDLAASGGVVARPDARRTVPALPGRSVGA